jgi:hypothetical protein
MFEGVCATDLRNSRSPRKGNLGRLKYSPFDIRSKRGRGLFHIRIVEVIASHFSLGSRRDEWKFRLSGLGLRISLQANAPKK